jgi:effector-binding domain-containing protein
VPEYGVQKFLYGIGAFVALLIIIGLALPRHGRVEVSATIDAQPAAVFALINDFRRVQLWSPRNATDPNARVVYSGPTRGVGATMTWDGIIIGSGTQTITESRPWEYVGTIMNRGEAGEARTWFDIAAQGDGTRVTWGFEHDHGLNLVGRYVAPLLSGVLQREHEQGLAALRELAETLPRTDFSELDVEHLVAEPLQIAYRSTSSASDPGSISEAMGKAYFEILSFIDEHELSEAGAPMSIARGFAGADLSFDAAIPVRGVRKDTPRESGNVRIGSTQSGAIVRVKHFGSYRSLSSTHRKIAAYLSALGIERIGDPWEIYVSDPTKIDESELLTFVCYPVREP